MEHITYPRRGQRSSQHAAGALLKRGNGMESNDHHRELTKSLEELMFGRHATRKNQMDIERFVAALLNAVREEVAWQVEQESQESARRSGS